jgi:hypothetical protein
MIWPDDFKVNGPWPHPCQGMQGTDSFYPFQLADGSWAVRAILHCIPGIHYTLAWVRCEKPSVSMPCRRPQGFAGTSQQQSGWNSTSGKWPVSLATAPSLHGPWRRYNPSDPSKPADAPCVDINGACARVSSHSSHGVGIGSGEGRVSGSASQGGHHRRQHREPHREPAARRQHELSYGL